MKHGNRRRGAALLGLLTTVTVASALLAGCSGNAATSQGSNKISLLTWGDVKFAQLQGATYNKEFPSSKVDLTVQSGGQNDTDSLQKFRLALSAHKNIPDIVQMTYGELAEFAQEGVLTDLMPFIGTKVANLTAAGKELSQYKGQTVAVPYEVDTKLWYYRSDMFAKAGIDVTQVKTQADFVAAGKKLQAAFPGSYMWNLGPNVASYTPGMIMSGNGGSFSTQKDCKVTIDSNTGVKDAFVALKDLRNSGVVASKIDDWTPEWQSALANGEIASTLLASWFPAFLQQYAPALGGKWAVTTWPEIGGAQGGSNEGGSVFVIPKDAPNKAAAARFLIGTLIDNKGAQAYIDARGGSFPSAVAAVDKNAETITNTYFGPSLAKAFEASAGRSYKLFPFDPAHATEATVVQQQLVDYFASNEADPASFLKAAQDQVVSQVGCPFKK